MYFWLIYLVLRLYNTHEVHRVGTDTHTHIDCTMQNDRNRHSRTINSEYGDRTTELQTLS